MSLNIEYNLLQAMGSDPSEQEIAKLAYMEKQVIERFSKQTELFVWKNHLQVELIFSNLSNVSILTVDSEIIF